MKQPEDVLKVVDPGALFEMTGKFAPKEALRALSRGARSFMLALRDVGGETPDEASTHAMWGMACKLPGAKAFRIMRTCLERCGWIRCGHSNGVPTIVITDAGYAKCMEYQKQLKPKNAPKTQFEDGAEVETDSDGA